MDLRHAQMIQSRLVPPPQKFTMPDLAVWKITEDSKVRLLCPEPETAALAEAFFRTICSATPTVQTEPKSCNLPEEGYRLDITQNLCTIEANTAQAVRYALHTIRQLMESERGVLTSTRQQVPCVSIEDYPAMSFRGVHLCWFPETPVWEIERQIRLAAYYKFNYIVMESWGVLKLDRHPEFCWDEYAVEKSEFKRLIQLGKDLGIRLVPQLNIFGHATCARVGTGKHLLLDQHPEYAPLFEPDGWTWCVSNPATRQYLQEIVEELLDLYNEPPYFHIGCDEAYTPESCTLCMGSYLEKLASHITFFHDLLAKHHCKTLMWHDMLLAREDPRWEGYIACGSKKDGHDTLHTCLPKSLILCDWQYHYPEKDGKEPHWPTGTYLKELGFPVIVCPWDDPRGGWSLGKFAVREKMDGYLQTVWHHGQRSHIMTAIFVQGAHGAWSPETDTQTISWVSLNHHLRQLSHDMGLKEYRQFGSVQYQVDPAPYQD
ncbi:MAG: family 20 glycosylhydrolase [Lentisphaeria bacterium]|nr:family 20 glycosylhydrolase [Lentisphaeria bacterium]